VKKSVTIWCVLDWADFSRV